MHTVAAAVTEMATVINPQDFCQRTACPTRDRWNLAAMQLVVELLDGAPVAVVADTATGFTVVGARLVTAYRGGWGNRVRVAATYTGRDGGQVTQETDYRLDSVGMVLPLPGASRDVKWDALNRYRETKLAAIAKVRAEHGEAEGRAWGAWEARLLSSGEAVVSYRPHTGNPAFADQWGEGGSWRTSL